MGAWAGGYARYGVAGRAGGSGLDNSSSSGLQIAQLVPSFFALEGRGRTAVVATARVVVSATAVVLAAVVGAAGVNQSQRALFLESASPVPRGRITLVASSIQQPCSLPSASMLLAVDPAQPDCIPV